MKQPISLGRTVLYRLSALDVTQINRRRTSGHAIAERLETGQWPTGAQAHIGNSPVEGDRLPMIVVRVFPDNIVNGQVLLDGNDVLWVTSVHESNEFGTWHWPPRV